MPALTTVVTHATGDVFPATDWNAYVRDNVNYLVSAGADLAALAGSNTLSVTNEFHNVTLAGGNTIDNLDVVTIVPVKGQQYRLLFQNAQTVRNQGGGTGNIRTLTGVDRAVSAHEIVTFNYDSAAAVFREVAPYPPLLKVASFQGNPLFTGTNAFAESDVFTGPSIPGGLLSTTRKIVIEMMGDFANNSGIANGFGWTPKLYYGGSGVVGQAFAVNHSGASKYYWQSRHFVRAFGATGSQIVGGLQDIQDSGGNDSNANGIPAIAAGVTSIAVDSTVAQTLRFTFLGSGTGVLRVFAVDIYVEA